MYGDIVEVTEDMVAHIMHEINDQYRLASAHIDIAAMKVREIIAIDIDDAFWTLRCSIAAQLFEGGRKPSFSSNLCSGQR